MVKSPGNNPASIPHSRNRQSSANAPLIVRDWARIQVKGSPGVSASVDGFEVHFSGAALNHVPERADAYLAVSLLLAMYQRRPLDLTALPPLSAGLLANVDEVQDIWRCWNPLLHRVPVLAREEATPADSGSLTFFSGGVDAVHSVLHLGQRAGRLVMINGFDFDMDDEALGRVQQRLEKLAHRLGHEFLTVQTNWINFTRHHRIARSISHGTCLAAIAHLLHPAEAYIASSYSWKALFPWGSHPLLDHYWGSDSVRFGHIGNDTTRLEKIALIAEQPDLLKMLWVCFRDPVNNCGKCSKCRRTVAMLTALDADTSAFPPTEGNALESWLDNSSSAAEATFVDEVKYLVISKQRADLLPRLLRWERSALRRNVLRRLWRKLLPGLAAHRDSKLDLQPWGRGPRPEL